MVSMRASLAIGDAIRGEKMLEGNELPPTINLDSLDGPREKNFNNPFKIDKNGMRSNLQVIGKIHKYLLKSSTTQRKYRLLFDDKIRAGPHTSRNKRSKGFLEIEDVDPKCSLCSLSC